jgi:hypothetical protein
MSAPVLSRRVVLLETDERAGLVAAIALACADAGVSLEITTGPGHVLLTFAADDATITRVQPSLAAVPGVRNVSVFQVAPHR